MSLGRPLLAVCAALLLLASSVAGISAQVEGSHWTSPTYGFRVSWQNTKWQVDPSGSLVAAGPERLDRLHLVNGVSSLYFEGATRYGGDLSSCVAEEANILSRENGVSDIRPYRDASGAPFVADGPNASAAAFSLTLQTGSGQIDLVNYVECRTLVPDEAVLIITLVTDPATFEAQLQLAQDVADTVTLAENVPQSPLAAYGGWIAAAQSRPSLAGPLSGEIAFGPGRLGVERIGVDAPDFYARAVFQNPEPSSLPMWDFGLGFRDRGGEEQLRLVVDSAGSWFLKDGLGPVIASGNLVDLDRAPNGSNSIELVAVGDTGYFAFNDRLVTELDLSSRTDGGDLFAGAGFFSEDAAQPGTTAYSQLEVWSLAGLESAPATPAPVVVDASTFAGLVRAASAESSLAGPETGELVQAADAATVIPAGVEAEDFVARVTFIVPEGSPGQPWDVGIAFREQPSGEHYRITVASDGSWEYQIGLQPDLAHGRVLALSLEPGSRNTLELVVAGDSAGFAVNGAFVSALDASALRGAGGIWIGASFHRADVADGAVMRFEAFTVWPLVAPPAMQEEETAPSATPAAHPPSAPDQQTLRLHEKGDSGIDALAVLHEEGGATTITVAARDVQGDEVLVVQAGRCDQPLPAPAFLLEDFDDTGRSVSIVKSALAALSDGQHSIAIRGGADDYGTLLACGDIPALP
ncbi:MAG: hypothetical protein IT338_06975 [Thermomicrobiales bacterium]|nr:hypothetical protein [Thermomicrobiales bacterium]